MTTLFEPGVTIDQPITIDTPVTVDTPGSFYSNLPDLSATDFTERFLRLFPRGWSGGNANAPGGVVYAMFEGIGTVLASFLSQMQFIANGLRIKLAYGTALDVISEDYFGAGLPRNPGESDDSFRTRILQMLLLPRVTRPAIFNAIKIILGVIPRLSEPWASGDTASIDLNSYLDVDGSQNIAPSRISDFLPFSGFIDIPTPVSSVTGGYPIYGLDKGLALDVGTTAIDMAFLATNVVGSTSFESSVFSLITSFKAMGITVWTRFLAGGSTNNTVYGFVQAYPGGTSMAQASEGVEFTLQSWLQTFGVWCEVLPWMGSAYLAFRGVLFQIATTTAPSQTYTVAWVAAIFKGPSPLAVRVPVKTGQNSLTCALPIPTGTVPLLMADWPTIPYVTALTPASVSISVSNAGAGNLDLLFQTGTATDVPTGDTTLTINDPTLPSSYALYATPSWATTMSIVKSSGSFILTFGTAAPAGAVVYWSPVAN